VVVVAYGSTDLLTRALAALDAETPVVVVDNGLSDEVQALCEERGCRYIRPDDNVGFASGVNLGLDEAPPGHDVLLLNPDAVIASSAIGQLQARMRETPRCAAVAPQLVRPDGSIERSSWPVQTPGSAWLGAVGLADRFSRHSFLTGAVLLLRGEAIADVGQFDERFFLYAEEADWQRRAQSRGWTIAVVDDVAALHEGGGTSSDPELRERLFYSSAELLVRKWHGRAGWVVFRFGSLVAAARRAALSRDKEVRAAHRRVVRLYLSGTTPRRAATSVVERRNT
jgi:GT2 family glycosyltransferase